MGWCDVRWKVLWQYLSIGDVVNFFGYLSGGIVAWQQRQHLNSSSMKTRKKKRDNVFIALCLVWNRFYKVFSSGYSVHGTGGTGKFNFYEIT